MANRFLTPPKITHPAQGSAEFDGSSDYIDTPDLDSALGTFSCWFYTPTEITSSSDGKTIIDFDKGDVENVIVLGSFSSAMTGEVISIGGFNGSYWRSYTTSNVSAGWHYLTITYPSANTYQIYLDGSALNTLKAGVSHIQIVTQETIIGGRMDDGSTFTNGFDGNLANVAIWNRALSSDEINSVMWKGYEALTSGEKDGLQAWYKLEESELFDASNTSTTNLEQYAQLNNLTFEGKACLQTALNALPDITDARLYSGKYDIRVSADGGTVEALSCVETELNALL